MINLITPVDINQNKTPIDYKTQIVMFGSCFIENIGNYLRDYRFKVQINPNGVLYNPFSIATAIENIVTEQPPDPREILFHGERWYSMQHHSQFNDGDQEEFLKEIQMRQTFQHQWLKTCNLMIITWGTAWVYRYLKSGNVIGNCHKLPHQEFERFRLSVDEIVERYIEVIKAIRLINPQIRFMFTISPIRHLKDGLHANQLSKATLLLAIDQLQQKLTNITYFPSYEIVMDELRDYRFYADDMTHITPLGVHYIWQRFCDTQIAKSCLPYFKKIDKINSFKAHRPFDPDSEQYKMSLQKIEQQSRQIDQELELFKV